MTDKRSDKELEAIKNHKVQSTYEMRGPDGSAVRRGIAEQRVTKDYERNRTDQAAKFAGREREKIASTQDMERGAKGLLSKELNAKAPPKDVER